MDAHSGIIFSKYDVMTFLKKVSKSDKLPYEVLFASFGTLFFPFVIDPPVISLSSSAISFFP